MLDNISGIVTAWDAAKYVCDLTYIYEMVPLVNDTDVIDLPQHFAYLVVYGVLAEAFGREGHGKNSRLKARYSSRYKELETEFLAMSKEWAHGPDQLMGQIQMSYGAEKDYSMRIWR
jgi:hypothetical protein